MDRLTELAVFLAVVDHGSFAAAARRVGRSPPTVTRIIAEFEARLGVQLFDRSSRRCSATDAGRRLAEDARNLIANYDEVIGNVLGRARSPSGMLRVTAPYFFGREHVAPLIIRFLDKHTGITCELDLSDRTADLVEDGFDLAVRIGPITAADLKVRRIGWVRRVIVGSTAYLQKRGRPATPAELAAHEVIQHGSSSSRPWQLRDMSGKPIAFEPRAKFSVNQADAVLAAVRSGRGLATALSYQVHADIKSGALVQVLEEFEPEPLPVQLIWPGGRDRLLRVRLLIDYLAEQLSLTSALARSYATSPPSQRAAL